MRAYGASSIEDTELVGVFHGRANRSGSTDSPYFGRSERGGSSGARAAARARRGSRDSRAWGRARARRRLRQRRDYRAASVRATGNGQRATSSGRRAAGALENRCFSHGVNKPRVGRRSKTHGGRCASRDHRQRAQQRAASDGRRATGDGQRATGNGRRATGNGQRAAGSGQRAHLKRGVSLTGLTNPVLGAVRRLTAEGALRATTVRPRSNGQWATRNEQRTTSNGRRATTTGNERVVASSLEKRGVSHGVSKPRAGRRSKTHGGRCASRDHRQRAQRATNDQQRVPSPGPRSLRSRRSRSRNSLP
jgi:hypothetical protein